MQTRPDRAALRSRSMRPSAVVLLAALASATAGCGPSVATLVRSHRVNEAFCRVNDAEEAALVTPLVLEEVATAWRVRRILASDLPALDPALAHDMFDHYVFVAVEVETRSAIARHLDFMVSSSPGNPEKREVGLASPLLSPSDFAALTGETTPDSKQVTETKLAHPEKAVPWAIVTLGASLLFADRVTQTNTHYPTEAERRAAAPKSAALYDAIVAKFHRVRVVAMRAGDDARRFRVLTELVIDNHTGVLGSNCRAALRATLESEPFELSSASAWPAGEELRSLGPEAFRGATLSQYPDSFHVR